MKFTKLEDYRNLGDIFEQVTDKMHLEKGACTVTGADGKVTHYIDGLEHDPAHNVFIIRDQKEMDALSAAQKADREFLFLPE